MESRASNLLVTRLVLVDGTLQGDERLCYQTFAHECVKNCSTVESSVRPEAIARARNDLYKRSYPIDPSGKLLSSEVIMQLGFDDDDNPQAEPPTSTTDLRVWDVYAGAAGREGMMTSLDVKAIGASASCSVFNTQRHHSTFSGMVGEATSLKDVVLTLGTDRSAGRIIGAGGPNAEDCRKEPATKPELLSQKVRFAEADDLNDTDLFDCPPVELFEMRLPAE